MIKTCCNVNRLELMHHIEYIYLAISIAIPRSLAGRHQLSLYHVHPQLQRTESHNRSLRKTALQTAHDLIHMSFLLSPKMTRLSLRTNGDVQLADSIRESRPFHPKSCCGAVWPADDPVGCPDRLEYPFAFGLFGSAQIRIRARQV